MDPTPAPTLPGLADTLADLPSVLAALDHALRGVEEARADRNTALADLRASREFRRETMKPVLDHRRAVKANEGYHPNDAPVPADELDRLQRAAEAAEHKLGDTAADVDRWVRRVVDAEEALAWAETQLARAEGDAAWLSAVKATLDADPQRWTDEGAIARAFAAHGQAQDEGREALLAREAAIVAACDARIAAVRAEAARGDLSPAAA